MADLDSTRFSFWNDIPDDAPFVHQAMYQLGFLCEFADLPTEQMRVTLALAECLKRSHVAEVSQ